MGKNQQEEEAPVQLVLPPKKSITRYCSWCFAESAHTVIGRHWTRNTHECENCKKETCKCMSCKTAMTRCYGDDADKLCYKCKMIIKDWALEPELNVLSLKAHARCSWCFQQTTHTLIRHNLALRSEYQCDSCEKVTLRCRVCDEGMARNHPFLGDQTCARCDGTIREWDRPFETGSRSLIHIGWCSWCINKCKHQLNRMNVFRRHSYTCMECHNYTLICFTCDNMARGGLAWNDNLCMRCSRENERKLDLPSWESIQEQCSAICEKQRTKEFVIAELERESEFRDRAKKEFLERPFLLLVSMPPLIRNQVACHLGWTLLLESYFGDPHAEAYHILFDARRGIQSRANQSYDRLNPLANRPNWYDVVIRVIISVFHYDMEHLPSSKSQPACAQSGSELIQQLEQQFLLILFNRMKLSKSTTVPTVAASSPATATTDFSSSQEANSNNGEASYTAANATDGDYDADEEEEKFFDCDNVSDSERQVAFDTIESLLASSRASKAINEQVENNPEHMDDVHSQLISEPEERPISLNTSLTTIPPPKNFAETKKMSRDDVLDIEHTISHIKKMIQKNTGMNREEIAHYSIQLGMICAGCGKISTSILCLQLTATVIPMLSGAVLPVASALGFLATPMFLLSIATLTKGVFQLGFGSSEGRAFLPLILILNQRLLLAIEDINIDQYY